MQGFYPINADRPMQDRYPFGADFFKRKFPHFIRQACQIQGNIVILELMLSTGDTLDVSHIEEIANEYLLVSSFSDSRSCEELFRSYIRYDTVVRINIIEEVLGKRPIGFNVDYATRDETETEGNKS